MAICSGFFFHAAKKDPQEGYKTLVEGTPVFVHPSSSLFQHQPDYLVYHELVLTSKEYMREVRVTPTTFFASISMTASRRDDIHNDLACSWQIGHHGARWSPSNSAASQMFDSFSKICTEEEALERYVVFLACPFHLLDCPARSSKGLNTLPDPFNSTKYVFHPASYIVLIYAHGLHV